MSTSTHSESSFLNYLNAADHLLRYIKGTADLCVHFGRINQTSDLHGYSDSDFAGDIELRKSTSGFVYFFAGGIISAQSKRQSITALSTTEAEYYGLAKAVTKAAWLRETLKQLNFFLNYKCCISYVGIVYILEVIVVAYNTTKLLMSTQLFSDLRH